MNKSILAMDAPKACIDCPCHFAGDTGKIWCGAEKKELLAEDIESYKPDWCILKDVPKKKYCNNGRYDKGWNDCIDDILNEGDMPAYKLLPCPFCRGKAEIKDGPDIYDTSIVCSVCGCKTQIFNEYFNVRECAIRINNVYGAIKKATVERAVKTWNNRI